MRGHGRAAVGAALLLSAGLAYAADPSFTGRWSADPARCVREGDTPETAPLFVGEKTLKWASRSCTIKKSYRIGDGLYLEAFCGSRSMPVGLQLRGGDKLAVTWDKTAAGEFRRCR